MKVAKVFTDRIEPMTQIKTEVYHLLEEQAYKRLINFYGIGGIGKTRFLNEFVKSLSEHKDLEFALVSLDAYEVNSPVRVLINIRKQLKDYNFIKFDYALIQYFTKIHTPPQNIISEFSSIKSQYFDLYKKTGNDILETFVPYYSSIKKVYEAGKKLVKLTSYKKYEEDFETYENMDTMDLFHHLPILFAQAICENNKPVVMLFDDYDSYLKKIETKSVSVNPEAWLFKIYKKINRMLFVVASRDKMRAFGNQHIAENEVLSKHLSNLSNYDIKEYLENAGIADECIINTIIKSSSGVPLYLDLFVDYYFDHEDDILNCVDFEAPRLDGLISRYLSYLSQPEKEVVLYIASYDRIDESFIKYIIRYKNIQISDITLDTLLDRTLFIDDDLYLKLDLTLKDHIQNSDHAIEPKKAAQLLMDYLNTKINATHLVYEHYLMQLLYLYKRIDQLTQTEIEQWINIINEIGDRSYLIPFEHRFETTFDTDQETKKAVYIYFNLTRLRRKGMIRQGREMMNQLKQSGFNINIYGSMQYAYKLLDIFFSHLSGNYPLAFNSYKELIEDHELFNSLEHDQRTLINATYKYGDLLFLYGRFIESKNVLFNIDLSKNISEANKYEVIRTRAHIYRLNYHFDTAYKMYKKILDSNDKTDYRIIANTTTSMAENLQFSNPKEAIIYATDAIEKNTKINSSMEIGKAYAAKSVAHTMLDQYDDALYCYKKAYEIQSKNGYKSGVLFAEIAKLILLYYCKDCLDTTLDDSLNDIKSLWKDIGVYYSFGIIIELLLNINLDETKDIKWLDYDKTVRNLKDIFDKKTNIIK